MGPVRSLRLLISCRPHRALTGRPGAVFGQQFAVRRSSKELGPDACPLPVDLLGGRPELPEKELGHRQGDLALAREDEVGPRVAECPILSEVDRAGDDEDLRVQLTCKPDRLRRCRACLTMLRMSPTEAPSPACSKVSRCVASP